MLGVGRSFVAAQARKQVAKRARREHYPAPYAILDAWVKYDGDPFAAQNDPSCSITALFEHPTTRNLIRIFFLQERMKGLAKGVDFKAQHVHVIGAGVMGGDIAAVCAMRGIRVTLQDTSPERLAPAVKRAAELFKKRLRDPRRVRDAMDRLIPDVAGAGAARADVVIEAIFENLEAKRALFAKVEAMAKPGAVLATNTSSLKLADVAALFKDPSRLVGIHFFNPVPQLQLVEVVSGANTDSTMAQKAAAFVRQIDKLPLPVKDSPGLPRQPRARALHAERLPPARRGREARDHRRGDGGVRHADGADRARRHGRPGHLPRRGQGTGQERCARRARCAAGAAQQGGARPAGQEDRPGHLPLRERQAGEGPARRVEAGARSRR